MLERLPQLITQLFALRRAAEVVDRSLANEVDQLLVTFLTRFFRASNILYGVQSGDQTGAPLVDGQVALAFPTHSGHQTLFLYTQDKPLTGLPARGSIAELVEQPLKHLQVGGRIAIRIITTALALLHPQLASYYTTWVTVVQPQTEVG